MGMMASNDSDVKAFDGPLHKHAARPTATGPFPPHSTFASPMPDHRFKRLNVPDREFLCNLLASDRPGA
jgi:hypothetical protein